MSYSTKPHEKSSTAAKIYVELKTDWNYLPGTDFKVKSVLCNLIYLNVHHRNTTPLFPCSTLFTSSDAKTMEKRADINEKSADIISCPRTLYTPLCRLSLSWFTQNCWPLQGHEEKNELDVADIQQTRQDENMLIKCFNILEEERWEKEKLNLSCCQEMGLQKR